MPDRKLEQEKEKVFKQVMLGCDAFDDQYRKYEQATSASQRDKQVDNIKRECKKLQRLRDTIKGWAAGNDFKDKAPLQEKRELIETKMEQFKAVEKEMKTKAFSKEGLSAAAKLDPKDKEKQENCDFLDEMMEELDRQIEANEAEAEQLQSHARKSKKGSNNAPRLEELETLLEKLRWHREKIDMLKRQVENEQVDAEEFKNAQDDIRFLVENSAVDPEFDLAIYDNLYDPFDLDEAEGQYGVYKDLDKATSNDNADKSDEPVDTASPTPPVPATETKAKSKTSDTAAAISSASSSVVAAAAAAATAVSAAASSATSSSTAAQRRPSQHSKPSLPASLASLSQAPPVPPATTTKDTLKLAPAPKPIGEPLKYASAASAAVAADKAGIGIAPLPPPPPGSTAPSQQNLPPPSVKSSAQTSPAGTIAIPAQNMLDRTVNNTRSPALSHTSLATPSPAVSSAQLAQAQARDEVPPLPVSNGDINGQDHERSISASDVVQNSDLTDAFEVESIYHLPASLRELVEGYQAVKESAVPVSDATHQQALLAAHETKPLQSDAEKPDHYAPDSPAFYTPPHYPQEPHAIFNEPRLYSRIDTDSLFYSFYYQQGTYQQYLAAKALKQSSWRFHKQYQTWFQRHEEPKNITEDYEQGTYRFFDYESTWMNRRKQDFKFAYRFLEDDL